MFVLLFHVDPATITKVTKDAARALEPLRVEGQCGVVTKLVHEAEDILHKESLNSEHRSRLSVIKQ